MTNQRRYTPKLRLLSAVLSAAMALTMLPMAAFAAKVYYSVWLAETSVSNVNASDVLGNGEASYDPDTQTLTLKGDVSTPNDGIYTTTETPVYVEGTGILTGTKGEGGVWRGYGISAANKDAKVQVVSGTEITLIGFSNGVGKSGADIYGDVTIRDSASGIFGTGPSTIAEGGCVTIENVKSGVQGSSVKVYGTLKIDQVTTAASAGGIKVYEGGEVTITGAKTGVEGSSVVDGGTFSLRADTCIGNGELTFNSGTLTLDSTSGAPIALNRLNVSAADFWYRTAQDGAWTAVQNGSWEKPIDATYFEITTDDPTVHYTVTFDLNGGDTWGDGTWADRYGVWNSDRSQLRCTTSWGSTGEGLTMPLMKGMGPERENYEFDGWYTAAVGGQPVEEQLYYVSDQHLEPITEDITLYAHWLWVGEGPEPIDPDPGFDDGGSGAGIALAVAGGAAVAGAAGFGAYELTTRAILINLLPEGAEIPRTRGELAQLLWQNAGKPEPAALPAFADVADADTARAAQWCIEQGLLEAGDGAFRPEQRVTKYRVIQVWKQAAAQQK